jgi:hypothetical protein
MADSNSDNAGPRRLETEAIVIGYAMSRLDKRYLSIRKCSSWKMAFAEAEQRWQFDQRVSRTYEMSLIPFTETHAAGGTNVYYALTANEYSMSWQRLAMML